MVIHRIINDVNLEINVEKINEKGNKVPEHWQDYEGLPSASAVRPDGQNVKMVGILMTIMMINDQDDDDNNDQDDQGEEDDVPTRWQGGWRLKCREML